MLSLGLDARWLIFENRGERIPKVVVWQSSELGHPFRMGLHDAIHAGNL